MCLEREVTVTLLQQRALALLFITVQRNFIEVKYRLVFELEIDPKDFEPQHPDMAMYSESDYPGIQSFRLTDKDFFLKITIQKSSFDIHLVDDHILGCSIGNEYSDGLYPCNWSKRFFKINTFLLSTSGIANDMMIDAEPGSQLKGYVKDEEHIVIGLAVSSEGSSLNFLMLYWMMYIGC
ncbi:hypothetical protein Tco_1121688 [Tanacetum coccineum]|uniref:Uncharacterized protein n=1 Tax=Tanacetum coccineum TaxID=301880 RepID=A0ABQ5IYE7_9ASTR